LFWVKAEETISAKMRPENHRNLWVGMVMGGHPLKLDKEGRLHFKWASPNKVYFLSVPGASATIQEQMASCP
jgi:hypothetical protein